MKNKTILALCAFNIGAAAAFALLERTNASVMFAGLAISFSAAVMLVLLKGE